MSFFENLKVANKVIVLLCLLGLFALVTTIFTANRMHAIDGTYSQLLTKDTKGVVLLQRLSTRVVDVGRLAYMLIAEEDVEKLKAIDRDIDATVERFRDFAGQIKRLLPAKVAAVDAVLGDYDALLRVAADVRARALVNDNSAATKLMREQFDPKMTTLRASVNALTEAATQDLEKESSAASAETDSTIRLTYGGEIVGLLVVLSLAVWLTNTHLARPIVAIGEVMKRLAAHDYGVEVAGTERRDEVGVMAKAVHIFKE
ncbi:MCP four helix bundle domain-containing protein, partial [Telmatospirillum sp.]|uniref:MCP four helix bundle domain-containing protein n=1 Tax=Telmatospirillum sp. TaxID=2079197 RepID=UPI00284B2562